MTRRFENELEDRTLISRRSSKSVSSTPLPQTFEVDRVVADVLVSCRGADVSFARPTLTTVLDASTRTVIDFHVEFDERRGEVLCGPLMEVTRRHSRNGNTATLCAKRL